MKVSTISVSYERKFNLGDYNSLKLEATCWADLEEGDDPTAALGALQNEVRGAVRREYAQLASKIPSGQHASTKAQVAEPATM